ncbi:capsule polysaccharide biosynthesis protein [Colletotrichum incanum]|uniref:Capsule polysaccharide biosynthesis protein n=1 Tax=Colletotrichum incanum TaxID=1573173 RepID=A0A162NAI0_COLIC|nr:capsule polysaccharide biosynthesis protein [Colletotrichum incanum]OHW99478.1 capsule polysaccharide biosynthesis protein [Colletotrichum incanum]
MDFALYARLAALLETTNPTLRRAIEHALQWISTNKAQTAWAAVTTTLLYFNFKRFPLVWHLRVFRNIWWPRRGHFQRKPGAVFRPVVTPSRVALLEMDYNLHKSNSTYFSDLDVARTDLLAALRAEAIHGGLYKEYKNGVMVLLAGTSCIFKKELKPGAAFDMHSRILTWDKKWLYVVTHFVEKRKGAEVYTYQPWKKLEEGKATSQSPIVFATAISKCVVKAGRLTVPPEKFLQSAGVLAANEDSEETSGAEKDAGDESGLADEEKWTWARVEEERLRALSIADGFATGLDAAHDEFYALG